MAAHWYKINCDCFPRYQYSRIRKKDILSRYKDLLRKFKLGRGLKRECTEKSFIYICICKSSEQEYFPATVDDMVLRNAKVGIKDIGIKNFKTYAAKRLIQRDVVFYVVSGETPCEMRAKMFGGNILRIVNNERENVCIRKENNNKEETCLKGNAGQTICNMLERYALNTLKNICEFLDNIAPILKSQTSTTYNSIDKELEEQKITKRQISFCGVPMKSTFPENGPMIRCNSVDLISVSKKGMTSSDVLKAPGYSGYKHNLPHISKSERENMERLIVEIVGVFNRSNIPKSQHPVLKNKFPECIPDELLQELKMISPKIRNYGFRFGTLLIYVETGNEDKIYREIEASLAEYKITRFSIVPSQVDEFREGRAGSNVGIKVSSDRWCYGTVGGFAQTSSEESSRKWALMSRHVAKFSMDGKAYLSTNESDPIVSTIMKEIKQEQREKEYLDIAVSEITKHDEKYVDHRYITENGEPVSGKLCEYGKDQLYGLPVHICGAKTKKGLGTVTVPKREAIQDNDLGENYIVVENRDMKDNTPFCKAGDSGAMVCTDSPDNYGEEVHLVSMVIGGNSGQEGSYTTLKLDKGLEELHDLTGKKFSMC